MHRLLHQRDVAMSFSKHSGFSFFNAIWLKKKNCTTWLLKRTGLLLGVRNCTGKGYWWKEGSNPILSQDNLEKTTTIKKIVLFLVNQWDQEKSVGLTLLTISSLPHRWLKRSTFCALVTQQTPGALTVLATSGSSQRRRKAGSIRILSLQTMLIREKTPPNFPGLTCCWKNRKKTQS